MVAAAIAIAAGTLATGCGSSDHPSAATVAQVSQTVKVALGDLASGRARAFCGLLAPAERARLARAIGRPGCVQAAAAVTAGLSPVHRDAMRRVVVRRVTISGDRATVRAQDIVTTSQRTSLKGFLDDGGDPTVLARRPNGRWAILGT